MPRLCCNTHYHSYPVEDIAELYDIHTTIHIR